MLWVELISDSCPAFVGVLLYEMLWGAIIAR